MTKNTKLTRDEAYEEVIAESCEAFLRDTLINGKAKALYKEKPSLWTKIKNALRRIIERMKRVEPEPPIMSCCQSLSAYRRSQPVRVTPPLHR